MKLITLFRLFDSCLPSFCKLLVTFGNMVLCRWSRLAPFTTVNIKRQRVTSDSKHHTARPQSDCEHHVITPLEQVLIEVSALVSVWVSVSVLVSSIKTVNRRLEVVLELPEVVLELLAVVLEFLVVVLELLTVVL